MSALIIDWVGGSAVVPFKARVTIPYDYDNVILVAGSAPNGVIELDTLAFWRDLKALEASAEGMPFLDLQTHNSQYTIAGTTYADAIAMLCEIKFEDTGVEYSVALAGSNNDLFDVIAGVLIPTPLVTVIAGNSAGLVVVASTDEVSILAKLDELIAKQDLTQEQIDAERTTLLSVAPMSTAGKVILRNTVVLKRWEADAWEDSAQTIGYREQGLESVGMFTEVAYS